MQAGQATIGAWLCAALGLLACTPPAPDVPPNLLLVTVDTLRTDRIGAYGSTTARTPRIDRLAQEGLLFENAMAPIPVTKPSHFSIFTSLYPRDHGVVNNELALPENLVTLPELFQRAGWQTAGFTAASLLDVSSGAGRGFDQFDFPSRGIRDADVVVPRLVQWLEQRDPKRAFFVWLHLFDPHMPYAPPPEFRPGGPPGMDYELPTIGYKRLNAYAQAHGGDLPRPAYERALGLYAGEVEHVDLRLGELVDWLEARGELDRTIVLFTADHGECFENGVFFYHSNCLYETAMHVPLLLRYPPSVPAGVRDERIVEHLDLAPTLLRLAGLAVPESYRGRDLLGEKPPSAAREPRAFLQHPLYATKGARSRARLRAGLLSVLGEPAKELVVDVQETAIRTPEWKFILAGETGEELYHLPTDPAERRNLASERPEVARTLRAELVAWMDAHPLRVLNEEALNEDLLENLRALGYVQ